jgi:signal transduction histidine kinase
MQQRIEESDLIRVLILEDVPEDAELMVLHMSRDGLATDIRRVVSEEDFRLALRTFRPEVILADYSLPGFDGKSAMCIARIEAPSVPFIFVSGAIGEERAIALLREGAANYVLKDNLSRLPSAVRQALREFRERKERIEAERKIREYYKRLRSLTSELTLAEERERRRLANELHETLGQVLAIVRIKIAGLQESNNPEALSEILALMDEAILRTRSLTLEINSPVLEQFGLAAAVEWLAEQMQERYGIPIVFDSDRNIEEPNKDCRILLFQSTRELILNSVTHANARMIRVSLRKEKQMIRIEVADDGVGFDAMLVNRMNGFGLLSIRERLKYVGGRLLIKTGLGKGTRIAMLAPVQNNKAHRGEITEQITI